MDLSQTLSNLASANQQLAAAHNFTLTNLQWLVNELRKPQRTSLADSPEKCGKTYCRSKHSGAKRCGKVRSTSEKHASTSTTKVRQLKKLPAFDESVDNVDFSKHVESAEIEECLRKQDIDDQLQEKYDRLVSDLEDKRLTIERLTRSIEESSRERERDRRHSSELAAKLENSELERARLLAQLETFQCERADRRDLEARLAESEAESRRHALAADRAEQRIRTLEAAIEAGNQAIGSISTETAPIVANGKDSETTDGNADVSTSSSDNLEDFKKELLLKREARQRAIAGISAEIDRLKRELEAEKAAHSETTKLLEEFKAAQAERLKAESKTDHVEKTDKYTAELVEALRLSDLIKISDEVTSDLWLQLERTDDLRFQLENHPEEHHRRINSLQRLTEETRAALSSRKQQVNQLKDRLAQIVVRLRDRSFLHESDDISRELERQVKDIGRWRTLIDERSRILAELNDHGSKQIHELKIKLDNSKKENQSLEEELHKTEDKMDNQDAEILNLESQLGLAKADCRDLKNQMSVINSLFTQMLLSASSAEMDLDRLTQLLQENHDLISGMAKETGTEAAALPKLLLDIIEQVDGSKTAEKKKDEDDLQEENIAHNLPKVWRVLLELLSCHVATAGGSASSAEPTPDSCYKSVDTPTGPRLVISVSKTYIRLKELILEKKHLEKEMNRMKTLNSHLENKLSEQEKRLSTVSDELSQTWTVVGRMEAQHQQLHTHEKILRYELQQKRKMLQELKQELEYCREKWESARQKNNVTEMQWRSLRREFAARKALAAHSDSFNNSGESGFSDEREEESDEDDDNVTEVGKKTRPAPSRRRVKKDGTRSMTPDTESEQPTDTECSEPKTTSLSTSGQRTPTPETETEIDSSELNEKESFANAVVFENVQSSDAEASLDPFDKALTNVIENLIVTDETSKNNEILTADSEVADSLGGVKGLKDVCNVDENPTDAKTEFPCESKAVGDEGTITNSEINSPLSVFKIGPFPTHYYVLENTQFCNPSVMGLTSQVQEKAQDSVTNILQPCTSQDDKSILKVCETFLDVDNASIDSQSSLETIKEFTDDHRKRELPPVLENTNAEKVESKCDSPSVSSRTASRLMSESETDKVLNARAERLRNLEEQAQWLVKKVHDTNRRRSALNSRLEELHETYGSIPTAPPMPDVLPSFRLRSEIVARSDGGNDCEKSVESVEERDNEQ